MTVIHFSKTFVDGILAGQTIRDGFSVAPCDVANAIAKLRRDMEQGTILGIPGFGSCYRVSAVHGVQDTLLRALAHVAAGDEWVNNDGRRLSDPAYRRCMDHLADVDVISRIDSARAPVRTLWGRANRCMPGYKGAALHELLDQIAPFKRRPGGLRSR